MTSLDKTFCVNERCQQKCEDYLTPEIKERAARAGMLISQACFECGKQFKEQRNGNE